MKNCALFRDLSPEDVDKVLPCLSARRKSFSPGDILLRAGDTVSTVGIILEGSAKVIREELSGELVILENFSEGELLGGVFACAGIEKSPVTAKADSHGEILWVNYKKLITTCPSTCPFHSKLIENMLLVIAQKNLILSQKIEILSKKNTREKLILFLKEQSKGRQEFSLSYNREEMAAYLCVDRSAMSRELCKIRDEGLISFEKNRFVILKNL